MANRIAVLEDRPEIVTLYTVLFESFGVSHGLNLQAFSALEGQRHFEVVLMDYSIPGDDFDTSLAYVKAHLPKAHRILISGHVDTESLATRYGQDFQRIFAKPVDIIELRSFVERLMNISVSA